MAAARRLKGFTLVELLIAMAILGFVVGLASYGFSLFSSHWEASNRGFQRMQGTYQRMSLVAVALEDTLPWAVRDRAGATGFYFLGRDEGLTLVTASPVFSPGRVAVIRLFREPDGAGGWKLVYEEAPLDGVLLRSAEQTLPFQRRMVVLSGLQQPRFRYFGWGSLDERMAASDAVTAQSVPTWFDQYDGLVRREHPQRIGVSLGASEAVFFVPERAQTAMRRSAGVE